MKLKGRAPQFAFFNDTLYRRSYDQLWLRCLSPVEAQRVMHEVHAGVCGAHQSSPKMRIKIKHMGYYSPTMISDCINFAKSCHICQIHGDLIRQPLTRCIQRYRHGHFLHGAPTSLDPLTHLKKGILILAATDYFGRWAEAIPLKEVTADAVINFFRPL